MSEQENQGISRERAIELVDAMSRTELIDYVQSSHNRAMGLVGDVNSWAATVDAVKVERDRLAEQCRLLDAALSERIEKTQGLRAGFADSMRSVLAAVREALPDSVADELREEFEGSLRDELADELRDELREEIQEECAQDVREAIDRIGWI